MWNEKDFSSSTYIGLSVPRRSDGGGGGAVGGGDNNEGAKQVDSDHTKHLFELSGFSLKQQLNETAEPLWTASGTYQAAAAADNSILR